MLRNRANWTQRRLMVSSVEWVSIGWFEGFVDIWRPQVPPWEIDGVLVLRHRAECVSGVAIPSIYTDRSLDEPVEPHEVVDGADALLIVAAADGAAAAELEMEQQEPEQDAEEVWNFEEPVGTPPPRRGTPPRRKSGGGGMSTMHEAATVAQLVDFQLAQQLQSQAEVRLHACYGANWFGRLQYLVRSSDCAQQQAGRWTCLVSFLQAGTLVRS
jgi:hypothetical protein